MDEHQWAELFLKEFCFGDAEDPLMRSKPTPMLWSSYFLHCMKLNKDRGTEFSKRCVQEIKKILEDTLTTLQELVLEGDPDTVKIQIKKQLEFEAEGDEDEPKPIHKQDKAALHYAVITGNLRMVELLLNEGFLPSINQGDVITKFTPLHLALFIESSDILWLLLRHGALFTLKDAFFGTPLDYARMLNIMPNKFEKHKNDTKIHVYNPNSRQIDQWDISTFEKTFQVQWCPFPLCTHDYIEELMFSGFTIQTVDTEFREKYNKQLEDKSGDENLVLAKIDEKVGWGVFARKPFEKGDYIVRYGGQVVSKKTVKNRSYSMQSGVEGVVLDATHYRNLGAFINHSATPNAQAECIFDKGVEQAVIIATVCRHVHSPLQYFPRKYRLCFCRLCADRQL